MNPLFQLSATILFSLSIGSALNKGFYDNNETKNKTIYVDVSLNKKFKEDSSKPYIHYNNGTDIYVYLLFSNSDIYYTKEKLPVDIFNNNEYGFEICSFEGAYVTEWIEGGNDSPLIGENYNYICLDKYIEGDDSVIKGYGYYGDKTKNPDATYKTQRVWLENNNNYFYQNDDWGKHCVNAIGYSYDNKWNIILMPSIDNGTDKLYYADIPFELSSIHFMRISQSDNHNYLIYQDVNIEQLTYGVCYRVGTNSYDDYKNIGTTAVLGAGAVLLGEVVSSYLTYGQAQSNGCVTSTVRSLFDTWFKNKSATEKELKEAKIKDYTGYNKKTGSYEGFEKNGVFSVNEKWNAMCGQAGIDPKTGKARGSSWSWLNGSGLSIIVLASVLVAGGLIAAIIIFIKRKKDKTVEY
jgi:hypothetical protein